MKPGIFHPTSSNVQLLFQLYRVKRNENFLDLCIQFCECLKSQVLRELFHVAFSQYIQWLTKVCDGAVWEI